MTRQTGVPPKPRPKRSLGQHFLRDKTYLERMLQAAELSTGDCVLEIGPGTGVLTAALAATGADVTAVELDDLLAEKLAEEYADEPNVTIVHGDILEIDLVTLVGADTSNDRGRVHARGYKSGYKVVANLPYYITSAILRRLLEAKPPPASATIMVQKEVAERICAEPGDMSLLAVSVQYYAAPHFVTVVPAGAFYPRPKVDSAIVRLDVHARPIIDGVSNDRYFAVVRAGFSQRRKQVANSLSAGLAMPKQQVRDALEGADIDPRRRAETFSLQEWRTICVALGDT